MTRRRSGVLIALVVVLCCAVDVRTVEAQCTYSISPTNVSAPSTGLNSSISVITGSSCAWTPVSSVPWITVTSGGLSGLGSFSYTVSSNGTGTPRTGTLLVGGQTVTVTQSTGSCTYSVSPTIVAAPSTGLSTSVSVITGSSCAWTATSSVAWITITGGASMTGLGSASYVVAASATSRTGTITVAGQIVTITQGTAAMPPAAPANLRIVLITP